MVKFNLITISLSLTFIYVPEQYSSRGSDTTSIWVAYSTVIFIIDTIDYVTRIGNYVLIASHDHYSSEAGGEYSAWE